MTLPTLTPAVKWQETDDKFCWRRKICTFLTHVLAQTLFCKHAFTNKHWALCLKHEYKQTDSLSPVSSDSVQASPGKIPIGACLTWLVKAYFTLCWPTSLRFLPSSAYTHPSFFYFPFFFTPPLHRLPPFRLLAKSSETFCMSGETEDRSVFFLSIAVTDCRATSVLDSPRQARSTLWNNTAHSSKRFDNS